jgi:hypothetical protein
MSFNDATPMEFRNTVVVGNARELINNIPDNSIDLILTDPVYDKIDDYAWLALQANRVLKNGASCLAWYATKYLPQVIVAMEASPLRYIWNLSIFYYGSGIVKPGISIHQTSCFWFAKGAPKVTKLMMDGILVPAEKGDVDFVNIHGWSKGLTATQYWIVSLTSVGDVVLDPFVGGGTHAAAAKKTGRNFIAFEENSEIAKSTAASVKAVPDFLFKDEPLSEQLLLSL